MQLYHIKHKMQNLKTERYFTSSAALSTIIFEKAEKESKTATFLKHTFLKEYAHVEPIGHQENSLGARTATVDPCVPEPRANSGGHLDARGEGSSPASSRCRCVTGRLFPLHKGIIFQEDGSNTENSNSSRKTHSACTGKA